MNISANITLTSRKNLSGSVAVVSSKSELHRLIFCACLADRPCTISFNSTLSKDIHATISCFRALGAEIEISENVISVTKPIDREYVEKELSPDTEIFCNESGSTARFILPLIALLCKNGAVLTGAGKLPERPFSDLCQSLSAHGAVFSDEKMPISVLTAACPGENAVFEISGNISSQYLSGLLFILPLCKNASIRLTTPLESAGYVDMTIDAMRKFGVEVTKEDGVYTCSGSYVCKTDKLQAMGDWSNAAFFLCGAKEKTVTVTQIDKNSLQPDKVILDILSSCGFELDCGKDFVSVRRTENIRPFRFDAGENPDLVPVLCVLGASICGESVITNIRRLRFKESDRVATVCDMISSLGGTISEENDSLRICGHQHLSGGTVNGHNDHRIVMSAAIAALFCEKDVTIEGANAASKSYPEFFEVYKYLTEENR